MSFYHIDKKLLSSLSYEQRRNYYKTIRFKPIFDSNEHRVNSKTALCPANKPKSKCDVCIANKTFKHKRRAEACNYQLKTISDDFI